MNATKYDAIIIGAGAAGLAAGATLAEAGRRVVILEARERIGGRIWTHRASLEHGGPLAIELGAEFIHGLPEATWSLVRAANLRSYELGGASLWYANGRLGVAGERHWDTEQVLHDMMQWLALQPAGTDLSFAEYLQIAGVEASAAQSASNYVEGFNAADKNRVSVAALVKQQRAEEAIDTDRLFRLDPAYSDIPSYLAGRFARAGGELRLNAAAVHIAWQRGGVAVRTQGESGPAELHASRSLITVPLGVLQAKAIEFLPCPGAILAEANRLLMGDVMRLVLVFKEKFWNEHPSMSFLFTPSESPATWWTPMPHETPTLTAWAGGPKAASLLRLITADGDAGDLLDQALSTLATVFGLSPADLRGKLSSWHVHDWRRDPFARGAYSYVPVGAADAPGKMCVPVEDTLYFAGEHTDTSGHWGTVHAALATGVAAARQILGS